MNEDKPYTYQDYYLEHHGVKGMHWGVRKKRSAGSVNRNANRKYTDKDIKTARANMAKKQSDLDKSGVGKDWEKKNAQAWDMTNKRKTREAGKKMLDDLDQNHEYAKATAKMWNSKDAEVSRLGTHGQKKAALILAGAVTGPVGSYAMNKYIDKRDEKNNPIVKKK